jgi:hypothetical protein
MTFATIAGERVSRFPAMSSPTWERPDTTLLGTGRRPAPQFPLALLGTFWRDTVEQAADAACGPVDYVGTALLCLTGTALGNSRWPAVRNGWSEPPILWAGLVGNPGQAKTPCMKAAQALIRRGEFALAAGFEDRFRDFERRKHTAAALDEEWQAKVKTAIKNGGLVPDKPSAADPPKPPVRPRLVVTDATVEKLAQLAGGLPRGLLLCREELAGWWGGFDRYGGGGSDRSFFLEGFDGGPYAVDRVKNAEPLHIRNLTIGVLGGVQPDRLAEMIDTQDDGFAPRFLWAWPDPCPNFKIGDAPTTSAAAEEAFERLVSLEMPTNELGFPTPRLVPLAPAAVDVLEEFGQENQKRAFDAFGLMAGTYSKARGRALRLAAILEFLWWSANPGREEPQEISDIAISSAAGLLDGYFLPMASRVYGDAALPVGDRNASALAKHLRSTSASTFNAKSTRREIGGPFRSAGDMDAACVALVDACLIRPAFERASDSPGRARKDYEVNPIVLGAAA